MAGPQSCPICSKIMSIFRGVKENLASSSSAELGQVSKIIDMPCPHADSIRRVWETMTGDDSPQRWSIEMRYEHVYESVEFAFLFDGQEEIVVPIGLVNRLNDPGHAGTSRALDPQWADPSVLRKWYDTCLSGHGSRCQEPAWMRETPGELATPTWLLDVVDECIVPSSPATSRYLTLSYTWGRVDCLKHTDSNIEQLRKSGALHPDKAPSIPRTVRDAMNVTKLLGERYLWVDALCINQDSAASSKDLNAMHHIYANSSLCLMAVAGTDAAHGLRGIEGPSSAPRDPNQVILDIAGGEQLSWPQWPEGSYPVREDDAREGSAYDERGWTFQEFVFAKRKLIFTDGPLRWICDSSHLCEESLQPMTHKNIGNMEMPSTLWMKGQDPPLSRIDAVASRFNTRYFTFEADALRGFLGIQNYLNGSYSGGLNHGHPEMFFDISLAWVSKGNPYLGVRRRLDPPEIKSKWPSPPTWSWMGWRGEFRFPHNAEFARRWHEDGFTESVAQWFAMHSPQAPAKERRLINCTWHQHRMLAKDKASKLPEGWKKATQVDGSEYYYRAKDCPGDPSKNPRPIQYGYPVPLPPSTLAIEPIEQLPFLFSKTSRCHFGVKPYEASQSVRPPQPRQPDCLVELTCRDGKSAGFLYLHQESDTSRFLTSEMVELVAVAKGWTTELADFLVAFRGKDEGAGAHKPPVDEKKGTGKDKTRHDCYFVLCVEWEGGVAKRQASGKVAAEVWERYKEPVDLILG